ncbi:serine hydrolase domain-containing protein [Chloroflexota bacterium]
MDEVTLNSKLQNILDMQLKNKKVFNAVLAIQSADRAVDWAGAVGYSNHSDKVKMQPDSAYFIASITKMYTAAVIMHLYERNLLDLDDNISKYLPSPLIKAIHIFKGVDYTGQLKIVHLLSQSSGLADYFLDKQRGNKNILDKITKYGDYEWDIKEAMRIVREELNPKFEPGRKNKAHYSDTNYQLLGAIIESVTGKPLQDAYDGIIFTPLGLRDTYLFNPDLKKKRLQPAQIFYGERAMDMPKAMASFGPDGGIVSNARENIIFLRAFLNGSLFPQSYLQEMQQWRKIFFPLEYGYGLMRFNLPRIFSPFKASPELIGHSDASASFLFYCPQEDVYLAGTLNQIKQQSRPFRVMFNVINSVDERA